MRYEEGTKGRERENRKGEWGGAGGKTIIKSESSEEGGKAFFRTCDELWLCHPERSAQIRCINLLVRPGATMEEEKDE